MSTKAKRVISWALAALQAGPGVTGDATTTVSTAATSPAIISSSYLGLRAGERSDGSDGRPEEAENIRPTFSRLEVADHCSSESCWMVMNNKVYDVTRFLRLHPGGEDLILEYAGHDATTVFIDKGHSSDAYDMLEEYCIGEVTKKDWISEKNCT